jgi:hypothetical protein
MNMQFEFAVAERLRRSLLDGWLLPHPVGPDGTGQSPEILRRPIF